ncbi:MAG: 16S rRNA (guanine(966)-N(2))-methyltransferase RsmD [Thermodesulfobacteriota bacterium]
MSLRILGGNLRGRLLQSPRGAQTRPTTSMLRKAVFDILRDAVQDAQFLDLFSGSGAMGIEALSRGAQHCIFVENHKDALKCIKANLSALNLEDQATVYPIHVFETLKKLEKKQQTFQIIYADPPYHRNIYTELLLFLDSSPLLAKGGILFLESLHPAPFSNPPLLHLVPIDQRRFGTSLLHQYRCCH